MNEARALGRSTRQRGRRRLLRAAGAAVALPWFGLAACSSRGAPALPPGRWLPGAMDDAHRWRDGQMALPTAAPARQTASADVVIAGGGVAGLAAARALTRRGRGDWVLLEAEDRLGGNSRAGELGGLACPVGAHYLPVPAAHDEDLTALCEELGLLTRRHGRWRPSERHLCHSPQERLFIRGAWQEGLLPDADGQAATLDAYRRFAQAIASARQLADWRIPSAHRPLAGMQSALDAIVFDDWLNQLGLHDEALRWYLDYCCRDDFGAGSATVSAWAGIGYFASRHGFQAPGGDPPADADADAHGVFTWPQGNGWITQAIHAGIDATRCRTGQFVSRIEVTRDGVIVDALDRRRGEVTRWRARACIVALPLHVAVRALVQPPPALREAAAQVTHAAWVLVHMRLNAPLTDRPGAAPAWDNVVYDGFGLGYVDAGHQALAPVRSRESVITWYAALGNGPTARRALAHDAWSPWYQRALADLAGAHPDLPARVAEVLVVRHGHAMAVPVPGARGRRVHQVLHPDTMKRTDPRSRLWFAHSDLAGYSVFEEAFAMGHRAGMAVA